MMNGWMDGWMDDGPGRSRERDTPREFQKSVNEKTMKRRGGKKTAHHQGNRKRFLLCSGSEAGKVDRLVVS